MISIPMRGGGGGGLNGGGRSKMLDIGGDRMEIKCPIIRRGNFYDNIKC